MRRKDRSGPGIAKEEAEGVVASSAEMTASPDDGEGVMGAGLPSPANETACRRDNAKAREQETESFTEGSPFTG
jgi:hypothetical protein